MDSQELSKRLLKIAKTETERACWLDGGECPYGRPEGQFLKRPEALCKPCRPPVGAGTNGCSKLNDQSEELGELMSEYLRSGIREELSEKIKKATTKVSSELIALADRAEDNQAKEVLKLAAELIEQEEGDLEDRDIVLLEDLD
jgi:hypothetical protein